MSSIEELKRSYKVNMISYVLGSRSIRSEHSALFAWLIRFCFTSFACFSSSLASRFAFSSGFSSFPSFDESLDFFCFLPPFVFFFFLSFGFLACFFLVAYKEGICRVIIDIQHTYNIFIYNIRYKYIYIYIIYIYKNSSIYIKIYETIYVISVQRFLLQNKTLWAFEGLEELSSESDDLVDDESLDLEVLLLDRARLFFPFTCFLPFFFFFFLSRSSSKAEKRLEVMVSSMFSSECSSQIRNWKSS